MSSKRKSHRNKKNVSYTESNSNYESDDDFENEFEPPSKKAKNKVVVGKDARKQEKIERKSPKQRLSIDEKLYQRDIETAIKISIANSASTSEEKQDESEKSKTKLASEEDSDYDPQQESTAGYESEDDSCDDEKENDSDYREEELKKKLISKKKKTNNTQCTENNKRKSVKSNKQTPVAKEKGKQNVVVPEATTLGTNIMSSTQNATAKKPSTTSRAAGKSTSVVNRNLSSLGLGGVLIKNPGPPIRVGLSRNIKVKPLHSKVSVPH